MAEGSVGSAVAAVGVGLQLSEPGWAHSHWVLAGVTTSVMAKGDHKGRPYGGFARCAEEDWVCLSDGGDFRWFGCYGCPGLVVGGSGFVFAVEGD